MTTPHLLFTSGSTRAASLNMKLAQLARRAADASGLKTALLDLSDYPLPIYDGDLEGRDGVPDNAVKLKHLLGAHEGIFIAAPEYNAGITPLLKNAIDWVSRVREGDERPGAVFRTRAFALGAATPSETGGIRGLIQLRQTLATGLGGHVLGGQFLLPKAHEAFDEKGDMTDQQRFAFLSDLVQRLAHDAKMFANASQT